MKHRVAKSSIHLIGLSIVLILGGCLGSEGDDNSGSNEVPNNPAANRAPSISGSPSTVVSIGNTWSFTPSSTDPDGDQLTFSVQNRPSWASFNASTGRLSGSPTMGDIGQYANVQISVSDGTLSSSLAPFSIDVTQIALGSATLSWTAPTQNSDGSPLSNLAGYKIYYGLAQGNYPNRIEVNNPGVTSFVVEGLAPATYYFVSTAVNVQGTESSFSNMASATVN